MYSVWLSPNTRCVTSRGGFSLLHRGGEWAAEKQRHCTVVAPSISSRFGLKPRVWSHVQATGPSGFLSHRTRVLRRPARCLLNLLWPFCFLPFVIGPPARSPACAPTALCRLRLLGPATRIPLSPCPQPPLPSHPGGPAPAHHCRRLQRGCGVWAQACLVSDGARESAFSFFASPVAAGRDPCFY